MRRLLLASVLVTATPALLAAQAPAAATSATSAAIDTDVWKVIAATVVRGDIVGMGKVYHPSAVFVGPKGTEPIADVLALWGKDMVTMKAAGTTATVEVRFGTRQENATTAFQAGAFRYTTLEKNGTRTPVTIAFEALLTKAGGKWRILMERQLGPIDDAAWDRLPH